MKLKARICLILLLGLLTTPIFAQLIELKGVVAVQNSKIKTGQRIYVSGAEIEHPNATKPEITDSEGCFSLSIKGLPTSIQTQITVIPHGIYTDYVIVNQKELESITLGRVTPIGVYICPKGELEQRKAEMVGINMRKYEERMEADKKRLQKELEELKSKNDYLSTLYSEIKDSLDFIDKSIDNAFQRVKEYAESLVLENLDERGENYLKAYECFSKGELDSVSYYLPDHELESKYQKIQKKQEESKKKKELAEILTESAKADDEYSKNTLNELVKEWMLLARTANMQNAYAETMHYYELAINADLLNFDNVLEYTNHLYSIHEYDKAEYHYLKLLHTFENLVAENPEVYNPDLAKVLNNIGMNYSSQNNYTKAEECNLKSLKIYQDLAKKNPKVYNYYLATVLNNLGLNYSNQTNYVKAEDYLLRSLELKRRLASENPKTYNPYLAHILNNIGLNYYSQNSYIKAEVYSLRGLKIHQDLAAENPKVYNTELARALNNIALNYYSQSNYIKAERYFLESLEIIEKLATENPKAYNPNLATTLNNLGICYSFQTNYVKANECNLRCLRIYQDLAAENPKVYNLNLATTLNNLGLYYYNHFNYMEAETCFLKSVSIYQDIVKESPNVYNPNFVTALNNLAHNYYIQKKYASAIKYANQRIEQIQNNRDLIKDCDDQLSSAYSYLSIYYIFNKGYAQSEQSARKALKIDLTQTHAKMALAASLLFQGKYKESERLYMELKNSELGEACLNDFQALEEVNVIPKNRKADIEKIKALLSNK